jgi:glycerophosphoryl diester phosphodiesterase
MLVGVPARFPFLDAPTPLAISHRGSSADGLENTLAAVEHVVGLGYRYLETDVRISRDGVLLLMHDPTLDRVTDRSGRVADLPWAEVSRALVGGREPVARVDDLLGGWPDLRVNLHLKVADAALPLAEAIRRTGALDRVSVGAFPDRWVARVRAAAGPRLCTTLGTRGVFALRVASYRRAEPLRSPAGCVQVPPRVGTLDLVDRRFMRAAHHRDLQVHAWTINDPAEMHRLLDLGVDGIMTDRAELLRDVLVARGQWHGEAPLDR